MNRVQVFKDQGGEWRYRIKGGNGEALAVSEGYSRRADAWRGYEDLRDTLPHAIVEADE